ncbi:hypothetical protein EJ04DRAFT_548751 [Polyplosphaeria fusca]|uniref:NB-ARC domain-containing protein n=1 Tax=Polyplosphaeria fusca TaxID=682080 RepID=A0A9P4R6S0_9PLEO|nr:hypothetical protein EJ04DRAFT_548751 [Polyplosphaeria fusca]
MDPNTTVCAPNATISLAVIVALLEANNQGKHFSYSSKIELFALFFSIELKELEACFGGFAHYYLRKQNIRMSDHGNTLTSASANRDDFSVTFSLSDVFDIEHFVAREPELEEMCKALSSDGSRQAVVLHGLGGIGKTQLTVAYAKRHRNSYSAIFWLNINDEDSVKQSFAKMARQILRERPTAARLSSVDLSEDLDGVVDAVKSWLSLPNNTRWLAIYDNYDNPKLPGHDTDLTAVDIRIFLPESYQGSVIVTTRSSQVEMGHKIKLRKLEGLQDGLRILSNASRRQKLANDPDAVKLAQELDGLPLALATAGAYLHQVMMSFSDYLRLYKESWSRLQVTSPNLSSYEDRTLYSTWQISYEHVEQQNSLSAMLLRLWAYFDNYDLWLELL